MNKKKQIGLICAGAAVVIAAAVIWFLSSHIFIGGAPYPKNSIQLDLRGQEISVAHHDALQEALPECEILWDLPFQGQQLPSDTAEITISSLTDEDVALLDHLTGLRVVNAEGCTDYPQLTALQQRRPECDVRYQVTVDGVSYDRDATEITAASLTDEEVALLDYLPRLETVHAEDCADYPQLAALAERRPECRILYQVCLGSESFSPDTADLTLTALDDPQQLERLQYLPQLKTVHFVEPEVPAESLLQLRQLYPEVTFTWEKTVLGGTFTDDVTEIDASGVLLEDTAEAEALMAYFPQLTKLVLGRCGLDSETLAAYRDRVQDQYKVVWEVAIGVFTVRTDITALMPYQYGYRLNGALKLKDEDCTELKYLTDLICMDFGHMFISDCSFLYYMPNMEYLILADTDVTDLTPVGSLKKLRYLEAFFSEVEDISPLAGCTALEDVNICHNNISNIEALLGLENLQNIWVAGNRLSNDQRQLLRDTFPDATIVFTLEGSTGAGWRNLPNYYAQRDLLGMFYLSG